jgi:hypothetical protein
VLVECFILNISNSTHDDIASNAIGNDDDEDHPVSNRKTHEEEISKEGMMLLFSLIYCKQPPYSIGLALIELCKLIK